MKKILVLYRELAGYFVACLNHLCDQYDTEAVLVAYPVHKDAPFKFKLSSKITLIQRNELNQEDLTKLCSDPSFDLIFAGGWFDKEYLTAIKHKKAPALLGFDNQWNGSVKHVLSAVYGRVKIKPLFNYAFVPGSLQKTFAQKLGFRVDSIITGAYSCDVNTFGKIAEERKAREDTFPRRLIYTGRYSEEKFIRELWNTFIELHEQSGKQWELHCAGTGPLWDQRNQSDGIVHHGFMQPDELTKLMLTGDAFVLPSAFEPWGVVVHEFAAAGYPMVISSKVGAGEAFLDQGENGYMFKSGDTTDLKAQLHKLFTKNHEELMKMGQKSADLAKGITPDSWAKSINKLM
jgi:glycosyltransferase involved in cell wall biosynthesis